MGPVTIWRFALVAVMVLLAPIWCRPSVPLATAETPGAVLIGLAPTGAGSVPAIRRHSVGAWWAATARQGLGRGLMAVGVVALLSLLRLVPWTTLQTMRSAPASLVRRRHAIFLRAPPPTRCA